MELLLLLLVVVVLPNRLGVGMEEDEVVDLVVLVGLLPIKENAGFGAAEESVRGSKQLIMMCGDVQRLTSRLHILFTKISLQVTCNTTRAVKTVARHNVFVI